MDLKRGLIICIPGSPVIMRLLLKEPKLRNHQCLVIDCDRFREWGQEMKSSGQARWVLTHMELSLRRPKASLKKQPLKNVLGL